MYVCCAFIAAMLQMPLVSPVDGLTDDYPETCRNCGTGAYCFSISRLQKTDSLLNVQGQGMNGSAKKKGQMAHFILNIQAEGMHASFKRFVQEINVLLDKEGEITVSSLDIQDLHIGSFPNKADQRDSLIINVQGKGTDASVRGLVQEIKDLLKRQCQIIKSSLYREGQETHAYISRLGHVRNAFLRKKRFLPSLNLGIDVSLNKLTQRRRRPSEKKHQGNEHRGGHFILNIHVKGTDDSLKRLVQEIKAFLKTDGQISDYSLGLKRWGIGGDQKALFILSIQGQGTDFSIKRSIQVINGFLTRSRQLTDISLSIQGPGLDTSLKQLIQEINASLNMQDQGTDVLNKNEHTGIRFILRMHVRGTDASVNKLTQMITTFLKREDQITDVEQQEIPGSSKSADGRALFAVNIQGLGTDSSIKRLVQVINSFLTRNRHLTDVSLDIQGQGIDASVNELIQNANASLNKKHKTIDEPSIQDQGTYASPTRLHQENQGNQCIGGSIQEGCIDDIQKNCQMNMGNCFREPCKGMWKENGSCGPGFYCCKAS